MLIQFNPFELRYFGYFPQYDRNGDADKILEARYYYLNNEKKRPTLRFEER